MRGEDGERYPLKDNIKETPPRARGRRRSIIRLRNKTRNTPACAGKTNVSILTILFPRNTPACAGKTSLCASRQTACQKHPRVRGEDPLSHQVSYNDAETPPRARGRQRWPVNVPTSPGNTPACAGKTRVYHRGAAAGKKHPRVRGEDSAVLSFILVVVETPPRARGRRPVFRLSGLAADNTPACAGKTQPGVAEILSKEKHPRVRGEDPLTPAKTAL